MEEFLEQHLFYFYGHYSHTNAKQHLVSKNIQNKKQIQADLSARERPAEADLSVRERPAEEFESTFNCNYL